MPSAKRVLSIIAWLIGASIIAFILFYVIGVQILYEMFGISSSSVLYPFALLGFFWILSLAASKRLFLRGGGNKLHSGEGDWLPVAQIRDQVVKTPQFRGRLDRKRGLLEATARKPEYDDIGYSQTWSGAAKNYRIIRMRAELLDDQGNIKDYIPVEIKSLQKKWIGSLEAGDRFRVKGKFGNDGILHAKRAFNFSTNSMVGEK